MQKDPLTTLNKENKKKSNCKIRIEEKHKTDTEQIYNQFQNIEELTSSQITKIQPRRNTSHLTMPTATEANERYPA